MYPVFPTEMTGAALATMIFFFSAMAAAVNFLFFGRA